MPETRIELAENLSTSGTDSMNNLVTSRFRKKNIVAATYHQQRSECRLQSGPVPLQKLLDIPVLCPIRQEHLVGRDGGEGAAGCTTSISTDA